MQEISSDDCGALGKIPVIIDCFIIESSRGGFLDRLAKKGKADREKKDYVNYTYIVMCRDGTYYTGWTNNLQKRIDDHNAGKGAKYTKSRLPVELVYYEAFETKEEAMRREYAIKQLTRKEKEKLIQ